MGNHESVELRCPTCGHTLERLGSREIGGNDADSGRVHSSGAHPEAANAARSAT
jgi:hypothetical protein